MKAFSSWRTPLIVALVAAPASWADVHGTDFDAMPPGPYPLGAPGMLEILEGDPRSVRIGTADDIPRSYRAFASAGWIRSGHFLLVDTRNGGDVLLRVAFCRGTESAPCVLRYEELEIGTRVRRWSAAPPDEADRAACGCSGQIRYEELRIERRSLTLFDDFASGPANTSYQPDTGTSWGGGLLGTDPAALSLGPFPFVTEPHVRLLAGDPSSVRIVPADSAIGRCWIPSSLGRSEQKLVIEASDSTATSVAFDLRLEDDPSAHCMLDRWIVAACGDDLTYQLDDTAAEPLQAGMRPDLGVADGRMHRLIVRVGPSCVLGLQAPLIYFKPRPVNVATQVQKWEADSLISACGPKEVYRRAMPLARGDYDGQFTAAVMILAAYGKSSPLWERLGWESTARAHASWDGRYSLVWSPVMRDFGLPGRHEIGVSATEMDYCLIDRDGKICWTRTGPEARDPRVSGAGVAALPQATDSTVALVLLQRDGTTVQRGPFRRTRRGWGSREWEAFEFTPQGSECLLTVHGGGLDSLRTNLVALDASGREAWVRDLGIFGAPRIGFSADRRRIVVDDIERFDPRASHAYVLSRGGEEIASYGMRWAVTPNEHQIYFADDQLRRLDRRKPDAAMVVDPSELYPLLPQYDHTYTVIELLLDTARSRFEDDPRLVEILRSMREDPRHRRLLFKLDEELRAAADSAQGR